MRVFVTGATGKIGLAVVRELIHAGHQVIGLSRSENGSDMLKKAGAEAICGDLDDLASLSRSAAAADGVIHLAFRHDFSDFAGSLKIDLRAVKAMGTVLEGSGKPFVITDHRDGEASVNAAFALVGVRTSVISLAPTVHDEADKRGFIPTLISIAREKGYSAYVGDGSNCWPAVHRLDAATLFCLALEKAPANSHFYGRAEEKIPFRDIAEVIGKHLNLPAVSISWEEAAAHFGFLGQLAALDFPSVLPGSSAQARELLGWQPVHATLIEDLEQGFYFEN